MLLIRGGRGKAREVVGATSCGWWKQGWAAGGGGARMRAPQTHDMLRVLTSSQNCPGQLDSYTR